MTNSNKLLCIIGAILIAFVGLFGIVFATQKDNIVKADTVVSNNYLEFSNFYVPLCLNNVNTGNIIYAGNYTANYLGNVKCWLFVSNSGSQTVEPSTFGDNICINTLILQGLNNGNLNESRDYHYQYSQIVYDNWNWLDGIVPASGSSTVYKWCYYLSSSFDINSLSRVNIRSYSPAFGLNYFGATSYTYYDKYDNTFEIQFRYYNDYFGNFFNYDPRTYYFSTDLSDNQYFQAGYDNGFDKGNSVGYDIGYNNAIDENKQNWIEQGKLQGIAQANDYTFFGLIGATLDAPISAFFGHLDTNPESPTYNQIVGGFFNFELLGVNLRDFFFAVLTFALVIVIIRFALGK